MEETLAVESRGGSPAAAYAGPLMDLRMTLSRSPWRIGPGWSVLAGALAAHATVLEGDALLRLFAAILLAELAWGAFWQLGLVKQVGSAQTDAGRQILPYTRRDAPAARLAQALAGDTSTGGPTATWYGLGAGLALAAVLSVLLGRDALLLTGCALGVGVIAWLAAQRGTAAALPLAVLGVGLPWLLGASLSEGGLRALTSGSRAPVLMAAAFTVLQWGAARAWLSAGRKAGLIWFGQAIVLACAVGLREPWMAAVVGGLFLSPSLQLAGRRQSPGGPLAALRGCAPWWLTGMLVAAFALRF